VYIHQCNIKISPTQADHGVVNESTNEKTSNCKCIYLFKEYVYTFRTVRIDVTVYERDKVISYDKVTRYKKCRKMEWCKKKYVQTEKRNEVIVLRILKYVITEM
jgi:hypothetical protein